MKPRTRTIAFRPDSSRHTSGSPKKVLLVEVLPRIWKREKPSFFLTRLNPKPILAPEELICCHLVAFSQDAGHSTLRRGRRRLEVGCQDSGAGLSSTTTRGGFYENKSISLFLPLPALPLCFSTHRLPSSLLCGK